LAAEVLNALVDRTRIDPNGDHDVILGCVTQAASSPSHSRRNAVLASRLPDQRARA